MRTALIRSTTTLLLATGLATLAALAVLAAAPRAASGRATGVVTGTVRVQASGASTPAQAIVYAEPLDAAVPRKPGTFTLTQKGKTFVPRLLAVPVGSTVNFPNEDQIFHNVFSLSTPSPFDLGLYRAGASKTRTFERPSIYRVFCNIHPQMTALIAVVPTTFVTIADASGTFTLDLPAGRYKLTALSERAAPVAQELKVGPAGATAPPLTLDESQFVQVPHKNKFGQEYPKDAWTKH